MTLLDALGWAALVCLMASAVLTFTGAVLLLWDLKK